MARSTLRAALVLVAGAAWMSCSSSSTAPKKPTFAGVWHVTTGALTRGTLSPTAFDFTVTASADSFVVSVPTLGWSVGPLTLDGPSWFQVSTDSTHFGFLKGSVAQSCGFAFVYGVINAARDSLSSVVVEVGDSTDVMQNCWPQSNGSGTANK